MIFYYKYNITTNDIFIIEKDNFITHLLYRGFVPTGKTEKETPLIKETFSQLSEYFEGKRKIFEIPIKPEGTEFQKKVWEQLLKVPYGKTKTYKELAESVDSPKACRAVGLANNKNPISIIIPCHRIIGSNGKLVGYAGGLDTKKFLLNLERDNSATNNRLF
ncbi:MAG: methylated-DNA--[protein]-cysteine S-methyltransferase [Bacteroidales bacterium]|jgi:methylated-DNA-[protein]-cysteine S-methyltransferase|nr:methylated-DNA--[protein]-cysteine S-methyltransferase [Bacteroidales bacterium]